MNSHELGPSQQELEEGGYETHRKRGLELESTSELEAEPADPTPENDATEPVSTERAVGRASLEAVRLSEALPEIKWEVASQVAPKKVEQAVQRLVEYADFVPVVASTLARRQDESVRAIPVSAADIREKKWWASAIHSVLSFFSPSWGRWFDGLLVRYVTGKVETKVAEFNTTLESLEKIENPQEQFVDEIDRMYQQLTGANRGKPYRNGLHRIAREARYQSHEFPDPNSWYNRKDFPMLFGLVTRMGRRDPSYTDHRFIAKAVTPEVVQGLQVFLKAHNREIVMPQPSTKRSLSRRLAERFARRRLDALPSRVADTLQLVYDALPKTGHGLKAGVHELCHRVVDLSEQGYSAEQIAQALTQDVRFTPDQDNDNS